LTAIRSYLGLLSEAAQRIRPRTICTDAAIASTANACCNRGPCTLSASTGLFSGLLGVGGGFIIVPALKHYTDLPIKSIAATSLGVLAIVTGGGAIFSAASGSLNVFVAAPFALAALGGLLIGLLLGKKLSGPHTQLIFSIFTLVIAISLLIKGVLTLNP